jgi:TPR repeat protein
LSDPRLSAFGSLRADYFDRVQADTALFAVHEFVNVPPLTRLQLHEVVTGPAQLLGVGFEDDRLPDRIVEAAASQPGALPLLSYLLNDMWKAMVTRGDKVLRRPVKGIDLGGVLAARAEEFLKFSLAREESLKRLLTLRLALVPAEGEPVRRQARRAECTAEEWELAEVLADSPWRLTVIDERETDGDLSAELAHEALLRAWPRLEIWLRDERDFLVFKGDIERAQRRWRDAARDDKALLTGLDLIRAEEWSPKRGGDLSTEVRQFVIASITLDSAAKTRALRARYWRRISAVAVVVAVLLGALIFVAFYAKVQARKAAEASEIAKILRDQIDSISSGNLRELSQQIDQAATTGNQLAEKFAGYFSYGARDYEKALKWYEKEAAEGDADAMRRAGDLYASSQCSCQNYNKAIGWYEKAAANDDSDAMLRLGDIHADGQGGPQDYAKAIEWYEKAAAKDNTDAMRLLGRIRAKNREYSKAIEWYERAADKRDTIAMRLLGGLYAGDKGIPRDDVTRFKWYKNAAEYGDIVAMHVVAGLYGSGRGVPQSSANALEWDDRAAAAIEKREIAEAGKPGLETARALGSVAWDALLAQRPAQSLEAANRARSLVPEPLLIQLEWLWIEADRAHALMFMDRGSDARNIYLNLIERVEPKLISTQADDRDKAMDGDNVDRDNKPWQRWIADDFAKLREAGLERLLMADIETVIKERRNRK